MPRCVMSTLFQYKSSGRFFLIPNSFIPKEFVQQTAKPKFTLGYFQKRLQAQINKTKPRPRGQPEALPCAECRGLAGRGGAWSGIMAQQNAPYLDKQEAGKPVVAARYPRSFLLASGRVLSDLTVPWQGVSHHAVYCSRPVPRNGHVLGEARRDMPKGTSVPAATAALCRI